MRTSEPRLLPRRVISAGRGRGGVVAGQHDHVYVGRLEPRAGLRARRRGAGLGRAGRPDAPPSRRGRPGGHDAAATRTAAEARGIPAARLTGRPHAAMAGWPAPSPAATPTWLAISYTIAIRHKKRRILPDVAVLANVGLFDVRNFLNVRLCSRWNSPRFAKRGLVTLRTPR